MAHGRSIRIRADLVHRTSMSCYHPFSEQWVHKCPNWDLLRHDLQVYWVLFVFTLFYEIKLNLQTSQMVYVMDLECNMLSRRKCWTYFLILTMNPNEFNYRIVKGNEWTCCLSESLFLFLSSANSFRSAPMTFLSSVRARASPGVVSDPYTGKHLISFSVLRGPFRDAHSTKSHEPKKNVKNITEPNESLQALILNFVLRGPFRDAHSNKSYEPDQAY